MGSENKSSIQTDKEVFIIAFLFYFFLVQRRVDSF